MSCSFDIRNSTDRLAGNFTVSLPRKRFLPLLRQMRAVWRLSLRGFDIFLQVIRLIVKYIFGISKVTCVVEIFFNKKKGILIVDKKRDGMRHYMKMF